MSNTFFTSDTHFCHDKEFLYGPRGFTSAEEMNEAIIERWNKVVQPTDLVYHLGDVILNNNEVGIECFKRLNGRIFMIWGNHDTDARKNLLQKLRNFAGGHYAWQINHNKINIYISHYPTLTANFDQKHFAQHVIALHGHTHQQNNWIDPKNPFTYHVGLNSHNCTPVHIDEVMTDIRQRWNEINALPTPIKPQDTYPYGSILNTYKPLKIVLDGDEDENNN